MNPSLQDEKAREEAKRNRMYDPVLRWKHIQETITWAEANMPEHLRRNRPRVPKAQLAQKPLL
jgi:ActR/RegA family two-component response regulator